VSALDKKLLRVAALAVVLLVVVHFLLHRRLGAPPKVEDPASLANFADPYRAAVPDLSALAGRDTAAEPLDIGYVEPVSPRAFGSRSKAVRLLLAKFNGGGEDTEKAVEAGLAYLAKRQMSDGNWSRKYTVGSTGLALCAFLGAGYHHEDGDYRDVVHRGLEFLLRNQLTSGRVGRERLYATAIAGVAFSEAYGLTGDTRYRDATVKVLDFLAGAQGPRGGWDYQPIPATPPVDKEGRPKLPRYDTSVTGWCLMAFKSARMAGVAAPKEPIEAYKKYAMEITDENGEACYTIKPDGTKEKRYASSMTAATLMCRLYMGDTLDAPRMRQGLVRITTRLPKKERPAWVEKQNAMDIYLWYHAAQASFLATREAWNRWNGWLRPLLVQHQVKEGDEKGSWPAEFFKHGKDSETYATALSVLTLQTYYRYYR